MKGILKKNEKENEDKDGSLSSFLGSTNIRNITNR